MNEEKICSKVPNQSGGIDYVLKNGTYLNEVIDFLPNGIINKGVTGIGATTLEIKCSRHSIIIQPLKATAELKSVKEDNLFFYNVSIKTIDSLLDDYLNDSSKHFKKIILVVDNLGRLISKLGEESKNFYLLFDEIDFMQGSSTYRRSIEEAVDIAKVHGNFAFITATYLEHSDPELELLPKTSFKYENSIDINLLVRYISDSKVDVLRKVNVTLNHLYSYLVHSLPKDNDHYMIAINNLAYIEKIADALITLGILEKDDISLHVSENIQDNKEIINKYSAKRLVSDTFPTRVNFITSAFFNGYDINETLPFNLILFSSPIKDGMLLTPHEILQIYGRNRNINGIKDFILFTHDITSNELDFPEFIQFDKDKWMEFANVQFESMLCETKKQSKYLKNNNLEKTAIKKLFDYGFEQRSEYAQYLTRLKNKSAYYHEVRGVDKQLVPAISYFKIDYWLHFYGSLKQSSLMVKNNSVEDGEEYSSIQNEYMDLVLSKYSIKSKLLTSPYTFRRMEELKKSFKDRMEESITTLKKNRFNVNFTYSPFTKNLLDIIIAANKKYKRESIIETLDIIDKKSELDLLNQYVNITGGKKKSAFLFLLERDIDEKKSYSTLELEKIIKDVFAELNLTPLRGKEKLSMQRLRVYFGVNYKFTQTSKNSRKKGGKNYILTKHEPFPSLVKKDKVVYIEESFIL